MVASKKNHAFVFLRFCIVCLFTAGFIYQTLAFLQLYWTFPTVVDIQEISPTYLEIPAFTFCSRTGYNYENICKKFKKGSCVRGTYFTALKKVACTQHPEFCQNGQLPKGFKAILYNKFMELNVLRQEDIPVLALPLEEYLKCTIEFSGRTVECNMENVLGSFYTTEDIPTICYTIYSKWGNPNKTREKIPKGAIMKFDLLLNTWSFQLKSLDTKESNGSSKGLLYNPPANMAIQIAVHSPYFLPSPYFEGALFISGRTYQMRIKLSESHLLPAPYQSNCTDYMKMWYERGGKAPIDQLSTIQECRINKTFEALGCIPVTLDYPHAYNICSTCNQRDEICQWEEPPNNCTLLADTYNQPCDSMMYSVEKENVAISFLDEEGLRHTMSEYDCSGQNVFSLQCGSLHIDVPFDRFTISNFTYNAKYESLELFSVIGGYMGMWLGISLLAVFDLLSECLSAIRSFAKRRKFNTQKTRTTELKVIEKI